MSTTSPSRHQRPSSYSNSTAADAEFLSELSTTATAAFGDLHKTNVLRLEVDELLQASTVDYKHAKWHGTASDYATAVTGIVEQMSLSDNTTTPDACPFVHHHPKVVVPSSSRNNNKLQVKAMGCYQAEALGMLTTAANARQWPTLDLRVVMPADLFDAKDYLKHRYFGVSSCCVSCGTKD